MAHMLITVQYVILTLEVDVPVVKVNVVDSANIKRSFDNVIVSSDTESLAEGHDIIPFRKRRS
jgi:hypothetical protein